MLGTIEYLMGKKPRGVQLVFICIIIGLVTCVDCMTIGSMVKSIIALIIT